MIERAIVRDAEQPWAQRWSRRTFGQRIVGARKRFLDDVLAVGDRAGHARTVAVQFRAQVRDQRQELLAAFAELRSERFESGHAASVSSEVMPVSPLKPNTVPVSNSGCVS